MAKKFITDVAINELSLIFGQHKGEAWAPINGDAQVLTVKGEPQKSFLSRFFEAMKAKGWIMPENTPDDIDHDGDGAQDYEQIISLVQTLYYDLQSGICISDEQARMLAVKTAIDNFIAALDEMRGDDKAKAGKRHSEADKKHLAAIADATKAINDHLEALGTPADEEDDEDAGGNDEDADKGAPAEIAGVREDGLSPDEKAKDEKEPYGKDADYADPGFQEDGKKRYPLDTEEHVRAAASFFGRKKNRAKYTKEQRKHIDAAIAAAEKKFGIGEDKGAPVVLAAQANTAALQELLAAKAAEIDAQVSEKLSAAQAAFDAATKAIKDEAQALIDAAKADAESAKATAAAAEAQVKAIVKDAMTPSAPGFVATQRLDGGKADDPAAAITKAELLAVKPSSIAEAIKLQNLINA